VRLTRCSIIMPAHNESSNILSVLTRIKNYVQFDFECLIIVDSIEDNTIPIVNTYRKSDQRFRIVLNDLGKGPAFAIRAGMENARSSIILVTMADGSDDPRDIDELVLLVERGVDVACASRYMSTGQQVGASFFKSSLSRFAGKSLYYLARVKTHDATNSFKAYNARFLNAVGVESQYGFEIGIEMVAKARRLGYLVAEIPTIWIERKFGASNFNLSRAIPKYLRWYLYAFGFGRKK